MPAFSVACDMSHNMEAGCCRQKHAEQADTPPASHDGNAQKESHNCTGENDHSSCQCATMNIVVALPVIQATDSVLGALDKNTPSYIDTGLIAGFYSIWIPPKIN